jgi:hypothetical protein
MVEWLNILVYKNLLIDSNFVVGIVIIIVDGTKIVLDNIFKLISHHVMSNVNCLSTLT